ETSRTTATRSTYHDALKSHGSVSAHSAEREHVRRPSRGFSRSRYARRLGQSGPTSTRMCSSLYAGSAECDRLRVTSLRTSCLLVLGLTLGCSSSPPALAVDLTVGHETGAMTEAPAIKEVRVDAIANGAVVASGSAAPGGALDLGQIAENTLVSLRATGTDA